MTRRLKAYALTIVTLMSLGSAKLAKADVPTAEAYAIEMGIDLNNVNKKYFADADFAINVEENLAKVTNGEGLPAEYAERGLVPNSALIQTGLNEMRGVVANANIYNAYTNPDEFKYMTMLSMFTNDEQLKVVGEELNVMLTDYLKIALEGNIEATADAAQAIFTYAREHEALLGVGGTQAIASDMAVVNSMAAVFEANQNALGMPYDEWKKQVDSYLNNANALALSDYLLGMNCKTK